MATDLEKPPTSAKFELFVEGELAKVRRRIRALDAGRSLLLLLIVTLAYFLIMAMFDRVFKGADAGAVAIVRIAAFGVYLAAALFFVVQMATRLYRQINPYYAARQLEETVPDAKNSVINWLDLKTQKLPGPIRVALGLRAARDLKQTDAEKATDPKTNWLLGGILAALIFGVIVLFAMGPRQFGSLLTRAFAPFQSAALETRTAITLLKPEGDVTIPVNQPVQFQAQIEGRVPGLNQPGAPHVHFRYSKDDGFAKLALEEAGDGTWTATMQADQVQSGFWYKVTAGDAETPEYQVSARSNPQAIKYDITYRYRPYRKLEDFKVSYPNRESGLTPRLVERRGTKVSLVISTNRKLKDGRLEVETKMGKTTHHGQILEDDPRSMRVQLTLEQTGNFRLLFASSAGEENIDRMPWSVEVLDDLAPLVELTSPAKDVSLPANGTLPLEGKVTDDMGIKSIALHMKVSDGAARPPLQPRIYRPGKSLRFDNGTYPDLVAYKDFLALEEIKTVTGEAFGLKAGTVLEYWLEATDNSDYPEASGNVGRSKSFKVSILEPTKDEKKQQDERKRAEANKQQHETKQDQDHADENQKRNQQDANKGKNSEQLKQEAVNREKELEKQAEKIGDRAARVQEEIEKEKKKQEAKADAKGGDEKGEAKPGPSAEDQKPEPKTGKPQSAEKAGEKKGDGKDDKGTGAGETKDKGAQEKEPNTGESKSAGDQQPDPKAKGGDNNPKNTKDDPNAKASPKENAGKDQQPGQTKNEGKKSEEKAGQAKKDNGPKAGEKGSEAKGEATAQNGPAPQAKDDKVQGSGLNPEAGGAKSKDGPKEDLAKQKGNGKQQVEAGKQKSAGNADNDPDNAQAEIKGPIDDPGKAKMKDGPTDGKNQPVAAAKDKVDKKGAGAAKEGPANGANESMAKDEKSTGKAQQPEREPTAEDLAKLEKLLKREEMADDAMMDIKRLAEKTKDPNLKKAAEEMMAKSGLDIPADPPKSKKEETNSPKEESGKEGPGGKGKEASTTKEETPGEGENTAKGNDPTDVQGTKGDLKEAGKYGSFGPNGSGATDDSPPTPPNPNHAKHGGNLQLEELKKLPPDARKKLFPKEEDWQKFLKDYQSYEDLRHKHEVASKITNEVKGGPSSLPGQRPREIGANKNATVDPLQSNVTQPPPEFREAQRVFTNPALKGPQ